MKRASTQWTLHEVESLVQSRPTDRLERTVKFGQDEVMTGPLAEAGAH